MSEGSRPLRRPQRSQLFAFALALALGWEGPAGGAEAPETQAGSVPPRMAQAQSAAGAIPVERIAPAATDVASLLRGFASDLVPGEEIQAIEASLPGVVAELALDLERTSSLLAEQPSLEALEGAQQLWNRRQLRLSQWLGTLTERAAALQGAWTRILDLEALWTQTRETASAAGDPAALVERIEATLTNLRAAEPLYRAQRDAALDLQAQVAAQVARCESARTRIAEVEAGVVGGILHRDSLPLWSQELWSLGLAEMPMRLSQVAAVQWAEIRAYVANPSLGMPVHLAIFLGTLGGLVAARRHARRWSSGDERTPAVAVVFDRPASAAALIALMAATGFSSPAPPAVKALLAALALAPMIALARPLTDRAVRPALYSLGILFALDTVRHAFGGIPALLGQTIVFVESVAGTLAIGWMILRSPKLGAEATASPALRWAWRALARIALVTLPVGMLASLLGFQHLAQLTAPAVLVGGAAALLFYAAVEIATAILAFAFRVAPLRHLRMVRNHRERLLTRIHRWLLWGAALGWSFRYLDYLGLFEPARSMLRDVLETQLHLGAFSTSVQKLVAFGLTLWAAWLLSSLLRFALEEEVYPRARLAPGVSYAASSLLSYSIAVLGFLLGLGFLGITLTEVTVFAGALGVGVGLGLQGVVQNFVAGLILLFEQPIHVGDAVQVGELQGRVRRIGIRASVVRTVQGAEVIIPNSELTGSQVTNWTLSDPQRRIDVPVGLAYGTDPVAAIGLLERVALAHPKVLPDPPPLCLFRSYGDSSVNFELRVWTDYADAIQVESDLTAAVYDAVYKAGLSFPFPQREIRILPSESANRSA